VGTFIRELIHAGVYKRSQGRITRQVTFAALALAIALGLWRLSQILSGSSPSFRFGMSPEAYHGLLTFGLPFLLLLAGLWTAYRVVNLPAFADFLIAVEAEMNKVSWPTRVELVRASVIVIFMIFAFAIILFGFDSFWKLLFTKILHIL
jgi:preprotein translocase subunit SecE